PLRAGAAELGGEREETEEAGARQGSGEEGVPFHGVMAPVMQKRSVQARSPPSNPSSTMRNRAPAVAPPTVEKAASTPKGQGTGHGDRGAPLSPGGGAPPSGAAPPTGGTGPSFPAPGGGAPPPTRSAPPGLGQQR